MLTTNSRETGIYEIRCNANGKVYVGSTVVSFRVRLRRHIHDLRKGKHHSCKLQRCWNKYGEINFSFKVLEIVPRRLGETETSFKARVEAREQFWIDAVGECRLNTAPVAGNCLGVKHGEEHRRKTSEGMKRYCASPETRLRRSILMKLVYLSQPELKEQQSHRAKENWRKPSYRQRLINAIRARWESPEYKTNFTEKMRQKWQEPEHRAKVAAAQASAMSSAEYKAKISDFSKRLWVEQRERMLAAISQGWTPEVQEQKRVSMREVWQKPGYKEKTTASIVRGRACKSQPVILISPDGTMYVTDNQGGFAKLHGLLPKNIASVTIGRVPRHLGWTGYRLASWSAVPMEAIRVLWGEHPELLEQEISLT